MYVTVVKALQWNWLGILEGLMFCSWLVIGGHVSIHNSFFAYELGRDAFRYKMRQVQVINKLKYETLVRVGNDNYECSTSTVGMMLSSN